MTANPPAEIRPAGVTLRDPEDFTAARKDIYDGLLEETGKAFPHTFGGIRLEAHDLAYEDPDDFSVHDQKAALLSGKFMGRRLRGTLRLFDDKTGQQLDEQRTTLMRVPHLTERGTYIHGGSEYTSLAQMRLLPGPYTRKKGNGEIEAHFNIAKGTGSGFRVRFEPATAVYKLDIGQSQLRLYSLLHDMGVKDSELEKAWGKDILEANRKSYDSRVFDKAYLRLVKKPDPAASREQKAAALHAAFDAMKVHRRVAAKNLPSMFTDKQAAENPFLATIKPPAGLNANPLLKNWKPTPPPAPPTLRRVGFSPAELYDAVRQPETGSQKNPWVKNPQSSAYGPVQMTSLLARDYGKRFGKLFNPDEQRFLSTYGAGRGTWQATQPQDRDVYQRVAHKIMSHMYNQRAGQDLDTFIKLWRGRPENEDPDYYNAVRNFLPTKRASAPLEWLQSAFIKLARAGAIVFLPLAAGKYLLQRNGEDSKYPGKLRPPGGGTERGDGNAKDTILRELNEEFGLVEDEIKEKLKYLGKDNRPEFKGTDVFELRDHGLEAGTYQASNDPEEVVVLEEAELDDPDYNGPHRYKLS